MEKVQNPIDNFRVINTLHCLPLCMKSRIHSNKILNWLKNEISHNS